MSNTQLASLTLASLVTLYNDAVDAYGAPNGMSAVGGFKSKSAAIERIEKLCEHGALSVMFDGDNAVIVDATPTDEGNGDFGANFAGGAGDDFDGDEGNADEGATDEGNADEGADDEGADDEGADDEAPRVALGDAKGAIAPSGFVRASDVWLKSNARGTSEREAYRKARRHAARMARKAAKAARETAE